MRVHLPGQCAPRCSGGSRAEVTPAQSWGSRDSASISLGLVSYVLAYSSPPEFKLAKAEEADRVGHTPGTRRHRALSTCVCSSPGRESQRRVEDSGQSVGGTC